MRLIFATNNIHKMSEIRDILGDKYKNILYSMSNLDIHIEPEETGNSFVENSNIKANALYQVLKAKGMLKEDDFIIADDTGLCIDFLDGAPGIMSARYMGKETSQDDKNSKILELMKDIKDDERTAYFITNLSVIEVLNNIVNEPKRLNFEGRINGYIAKTIEKKEGFGYDPIFAVGDPGDIARGSVKTYSNIGVKEKNKISHRAIALNKFVQYLENNHNI